MMKWLKANFRKLPGLAMLAVIAGAALVSVGNTVMYIAGFAIWLSTLALHYAFYRCPHCGTYLWRNFGNYCQECGRRLDDPVEEDK